MKRALAVALTLLVIAAVAGAALALTGATVASRFIWIAGVLASTSVLFLAPWLIQFWSRDEPDVE